ncbi:fimbrial-like adhesin protein [Escherichia coli]|uniref:Fimbrial-like adhesin protein n=1 Tax=Escherichia coli TaxID=562 RepID=A0A376RMR4_ECOLX|nr:fimbrial-like adhesin protein [Escherichia coli]
MRVITTTIFCRRLNAMVRSTAAYSGQCHTTQGNPYIGVNFGVKPWRKKKIRLE